MDKAIKLRLIARVAKLYYEQHMAQKQIADYLHVSQATISRLLKKAHEEEIVRTTLNIPNGVYSELEDAICSAYGIQEAIVADCISDQTEDIYRSIGSAAAYFLETTLQHHEVVGISSWSSSLLAMVEAMSPLTNINNTRVVQILGGLGNPSAEIHATHLTKRLATLIKGEPVFLPAPGVVPSADKRKLFLEDPYVAEAFRMFDQISLALVGIGALEPSRLLASSGNIFSENELNQLKAVDAMGDICLNFFDKNGKLVRSPLKERVIGMPIEKLKNVNRSVGVAGGQNKVPAIKAAMRGKYINILITDKFTAERLL